MSGPEAAIGLILSGASTAASISGQRQQAAMQRRRIAAEQQQRALQQRVEERRIARERDKQLASQRARMGAAGVGGSGGSADAIFAGIRADADQQVFDLRSGDALAKQSASLLDDDDTASSIEAISGFGQQVIREIPWN